MSKLEVDQVDPQSGTSLTLGTSGDTINIPSGVTLANAGTATGFAAIAWQSSIVTAATLNADANKGYWIDTSSNACTVTLPGSASVGDQLYFVDYARNFGTNALTINPNSLNYQGNTSPNPVYNTNGQAIAIVYSGATKGWIPTTDDDVTMETPQTVTVDFLNIGGGGGSAGTSNNFGGGGGAGGYRNSYSSESSGGGGSSETSLTFTKDASYTITVGAGGASATGASDNATTQGTDSSIVGTGVSITSAGGGGSAISSSVGDQANNGRDGGSGGGATGGGTGGSGTSNQGFAGGNSTSSTNGGGGGGASAVGSNGSGTTGGAGGAGLSSSITGSAVSRGGGGGASGQASAGTGGSGGGGPATTGSRSSTQSGTVNTGGGGGGFNGGPAGGLGGSGVVILRAPTASFSSVTVTGSPTSSTDGSDTIHVFTGTGSITYNS